MTRFGAWLLFLISCTRPADQCTSNADCKDPQYPFCDVYGQYPASGGATDVCTITPTIDAALPDAGACTPGEIRACNGEQAETCNAAGSGYELDDCMLGCIPGPTPHCAYLQPTYLPNVCDTPATPSTFTVVSSGSFDPNLDTNCTGGIIAQTGASEVCVVHYGAIDIGSGATLTIIGSPVGSGSGRAIAFVADTDLTIDGMIDVAGHVGSNGPGGGTFTSGAAPSQTSTPNTEQGGGGAGGATAGAAGAINYPAGSAGTSGSNGGANNGGDATMNPATFAALAGGASTPPPAGVSEPNAFDQYAGGGGGVLELISCRSTVSISGTLNAGGGGGGGGFSVVVVVSGFGGGAGGNVVIEGANVSLSGSVFANGGAGGGGCLINGSVVVTGPNGPDGSLSDSQPALGPSLDASGAGGNGGYVGSGPTVGKKGVGNLNCPGGGGGSVGFIQTYTPAGVTPTLAPAHVSPALQPDGTVSTR